MSARRKVRIVKSKPSSTQPRNVATNAFHCVAVTSRYQGVESGFGIGDLGFGILGFGIQGLRGARCSYGRLLGNRTFKRCSSTVTAFAACAVGAASAPSTTP